MKKFLIAFVLFVAVLAFTACSTDETDTLPMMEPSEQLIEDSKFNGEGGGQEEDEGEEGNTGDPGNTGGGKG